MKRLSEIDFMHCSRRSLLLFVTIANVVGWIVIAAVVYGAYLAYGWVMA
ncbi:hypothetical protein ACNPNM_04110 [Klebsiella variicola]|nr:MULTISPECIES: hypothetical protein [Klebsiella]HBQ5882020.1 hypothetical protein [Klebsiella pneumoniae subsp. pneumoniae]HCA9960781.1 hypothetical protein [Klebsiella quasipneumoniae subsp. quasipneumoniae]MCD6611854.1 hypothetical protein [Klebsiella quasipneumoniae subsp. similipneumoniae]MCP6656223.1 hypothetical protein [Klebsiella pneumoniae]MCP6669131.1 hypothetical protein [Klebsiella pneumoniae]